MKFLLGLVLSIFIILPARAAVEDVTNCVNVLAANLNKEMEACSGQYGVDFGSVGSIYSEEQLAGYSKCVSSYQEKYNSGLKSCYQNNSFASFWDLPILKQSLLDQIGSGGNLTSEQSASLGNCLQGVAVSFDLKNYSNLPTEIAAAVQTEIAGCFEKSGMKAGAKVYQNVATAIDCSQETFGIKNLQEAGVIFLRRTPVQSAYMEKCLIKRLSPVAIGAAAVNIPLAAGWQNTILLAQFIFTQPLLLLTKKGKKRGQVFNMLNKIPLDLGLVRLFDDKSGKVLRSMVTNAGGEYFFLTDPGEYRLEVKKPGFKFPSDLAKQVQTTEGYYLGETIKISKSADTVGKSIPADPEVLSVKKTVFYGRKFRRYLVMGIAFSAPLFAALSLFFVFKWWTAALLFFHVVLLLFFIRLARKDKVEKFGVIRDENNKPVAGVMVHLFKNEFDKLLGFCVSDFFGRYYFPPIVGEFTLVFKKKLYRDAEAKVSLLAVGSPNLTIKMERIIDS